MQRPQPVIYYGEDSHVTFRDCGCVAGFWPVFGEEINCLDADFIIHKAALMARKMSKFRDENGIFLRLNPDISMVEFIEEVIIFTRGYKDWVVS